MPARNAGTKVVRGRKAASKSAPPTTKAPVRKKGKKPASASPAGNGQPVRAAAAADACERQRLVQKGGGVVDVHSEKAGSCHVYKRSGSVYQCTLHQTNISQNNNKFYIIQVLEEDSGGCYHVFTRWGRVGLVGMNKLVTLNDADAAVRAFCGHFSRKTSNEWERRAGFVKRAGKYHLMDIDYGVREDSESGKGSARRKRKAEPKCKLPAKLKQLMELIVCEDTMVGALREFEIDTNRMPLGKISKGQVLQAYSVLKEVEECLGAHASKLEELSSRFYTLIPHSFGAQRPPVIRTREMIKQKLKMLEVLGELEIAARCLDAPQGKDLHPLDSAYLSLNCELRPLPGNSAVYKRVEEYLRNTHGGTHSSYTLQVKAIFTVRRDGEDELFEPYKKLGNRQLLWHGSRVTNFMGILSQGLRIAPPEAPCTGYMFGKGIYFSSVGSKSANYCHPSSKDNTGLMLLCEVALGKSKEYERACYMETAQRGTTSTVGVGRVSNDPAGSEVVDDVLWPKGRLVESPHTRRDLLYPEYIVYKTEQCAIRYLVQVEFIYNRGGW
uniref:Poly [ADP-ribose] polymerase n=1 Tax=Trypanosoma vivax (strain Y486) TaxID=1055687 RepID=G0TVS4_TRYVY|nr:putative poly(ADP-ribose) polymerase [Trypanosoma vivax Y486]